MEIKERINSWLNSPVVDDHTKEAIKAMSANEQTECFYKDLEFGTGGLRGEMGPGTNRMNRYTVGMATQGMANYLKRVITDEKIKVVIAYDSRNNSQTFAQLVADVMSANDIQAFIFPELRPTPQLSFAVRHLSCHAGVVITASHNPKEYNGFKAYWSDGGQLIPPHDTGVIDEVRKIKSFEEVLFDPKPANIQLLDDKIDAAYLDTLQSLSMSADVDRDIKIVYSSIHGTGITQVPAILRRLGFDQVTVVEEQAEANGNFPTVIYPNPEEAEAMKLALQKAKEIDADLILATDPDADRVGMGVKNQDGEFQLLNGNQAATILIYYLLSRHQEQGFKGNEFIAKTIVTTDLLSNIAEAFGVKSYETLTGFKYIAELIREKEGKEKFIGGGEESYGYLVGDAVRDKDAVVSCMILAEAIAWAESRGLTPFDLLLDIYSRYGFFKERLYSLTKKGKSGAEEIEAMMKRFRETPPEELAGSRVVKVLDFQEGTVQNRDSGTLSNLDFPTSNVLQFLTEDQSKVSIRPSGTEPKIKFYFSTKTQLTSKDQYGEMAEILEKKLDSLQNAMIG